MPKEKSLLLHALSRCDRMLEPSSLPVTGTVWAFPKKECSRNAFIAYCLEMLSHLGMQVGNISWDQELMTFDVSHYDSSYTVVISLKDDSVASGFFYFFGLWQQCLGKQTFPIGLNLLEMASLPTATLRYQVLFANEPLERAQLAVLLDGNPVTEQLYDGAFHISSNALLDSPHDYRFVIAPNHKNCANKQPIATHAIQHILYSLRNLNALLAETMVSHDCIWQSHEESELYTRIMLLMQKARSHVAIDAWDALVCENGELLLSLETLYARREHSLARINDHKCLANTIRNEMQMKPISGAIMLWPSLSLPFEHACHLLRERLHILDQARRQAEVLLNMLNARMLAKQLTITATTNKTDVTQL
ncbi:MAG: hypothetical protein R8L53_04005 [Mariprofundales bacterium]